MIFKSIPAPLACAMLGASVCLNANAVELSSEAQAGIRRGTQGSLLFVPEVVDARRRLPVIPLSITLLPGPPLLFSDLPEYLGPSNGVALMEDVAEGDYRLYVYHVPGSKEVCKTVSVVVENLGKKKLRLRFARSAFPKPGMDYAAMGVAGLMEFFTGHNVPPPLSIAPGAWQVLDERLDQTVAADPQLVHAFYEFHINQPARIAVLQRDTNQVSTDVVDVLPRLPRSLPGESPSGAGRGIFRTADIVATNLYGSVVDTTNGVQRLLLADGRRDPWVRGFDGLAGNMAVTNKGNYGVIYHIRLAWKSSDDRSLALLIGAPGSRMGEEIRPMAAVKVSDGIWKGGWQAISATGALSHQPGEVALAQKFAPPSPGTTNYLEIIYSPPGGSSLPTSLFFAPFQPLF
jgi:hypothetical protein